LLHGRLPRNPPWTDVIELIEHLGQVQPHGGEEFAFVIGTHREIFKKPHNSEFPIDEVSRLRWFLKGAASESPVAGVAQSGRMVVVIDHHAAHIFRHLDGSTPQDEVKIEPYDPHHFHHHLVHRKDAHYRGDRVPEEASFYEEVATTLVPATQIVLIGSGTGKSSAVEALVEYLKKHRSDISRRVTATEIVDLSALTVPGIEAIAKRHMNSVD